MTGVIQAVSLDVPHCTLTYGTAPCTAAVGVTGTRKCFNSLGTCQDLPHFTEEIKVYVFTADIATSIETYALTALVDTFYPFIKSVDYQPAIVSLEGKLGQRASLKVVFKDAPHSDTPASEFDKYASTRTYDPYKQGTFWGKFRARNPYMRGRKVVLYIGQPGQPVATYEARSFLIDSMDGPNADGTFTITAQDVLRFASGDLVVAPPPCSGFLAADISVGTGSTTISPTGALADPANAYPASGYGCFGGNEIVHYTGFVGDLVTVDLRGQFNTAEVAHTAGDRFQAVGRTNAVNPADVLYSLLVDFAGINPAYITIGDWHTESATYLGTNISWVIPEPTPVDQLIEEVLETTGSALWWDDVNQQIRWQVIRSIPTTAFRFTEDNVLAGTLEITEQPEKRVSQVIVYYGQINPTLKLDETRNYRSTETVTDTASESLEGSASIKTIYSRLIVGGGRTVANKLATRYLNRYKRAPRRFKFEVFRYSVTAPSLGGGYLLGGGVVRHSSWPFQDDTGARAEVPIQLTSVSAAPDRWIVEAEEMLASAVNDTTDPHTRNIIFDSNQNNVNLKATHDALFAPAVSGDTVNCTINAGIIIGSVGTGAVAFDIGGTWASGVTINVVNNGRVEGAGGAGGVGTIGANSTASSATTTAGLPGGTALFTRRAFNLTNNSQIWGGGGGGGAAWVHPTEAYGGGGGAGTVAGVGGTATGGTFLNKPGNNATSDAGGLGGKRGTTTDGGGDGGGPGLAGATAINSGFPTQVRTGGATGSAIDGISFITSLATGDRRGPQIN